MNKIEKEILEIINQSASEHFEHKFKSLQDSCADPNPPYTMRITPLTFYFLNRGEILGNYSSISPLEPNEIFTEEKLDYLIQHSPLHYLYPAELVTGSAESGYINPLLMAFHMDENLKLTGSQYDYMIAHSDLSVGKDQGHPALIMALFKFYPNKESELSEESWSLLNQSARNFDEKYIDDLEIRSRNPNDEYYLATPQVAERLRQVTREQHIIMAKESMESTLSNKSDPIAKNKPTKL